MLRSLLSVAKVEHARKHGLVKMLLFGSAKDLITISNDFDEPLV
ncbi:hypothetical protein [Nostoc sp.]